MAINRLTLSIAGITLSDGQRKVRGVAYAGGVLNTGWQHLAIDLDSLQFSGKQIPLLHNHNSSRHVGFGYLSREDNQLIVSGEMLSNADAADIVKASDEGLHWQMSVGVESERVITRHKGDIVNGETLSVDDVAVFSDAVIREVSFTPTGVDADTSAQILSLSSEPIRVLDLSLGENTMSKESEPSTTTSEVLGKTQSVADLSSNSNRVLELSAEISQKDAQITQLKADLAAKETELQAQAKQAKLSQLAELGIDGDDAETLAGLDDAAFNAMTAQMKLSRKQTEVLGADYSHNDDSQTRANPLKAALGLKS